MKNCLVTTLKSSVADEMLVEFGYVGIMFKSNGITNFDISQTSQITFSGVNKPSKLIGDAYFVDNGGVNRGKSYLWTSPNNGYKIHVNSGDVILELPIGNMRTPVQNKIINYDTNYIKNCYIELDLDEYLLAFTEQETASSYGYGFNLIVDKMTGDLTALNNKVAGRLNLNCIEKSSVTGSINDITFKNVNISGTGTVITFKNLPLITGNLETFLNHYAAACSISMNNITVVVEGCPGVFYNGSPCYDVSIKIDISEGAWQLHT